MLQENSSDFIYNLDSNVKTNIARRTFKRRLNVAVRGVEVHGEGVVMVAYKETHLNIQQIVVVCTSVTCVLS